MLNNLVDLAIRLIRPLKKSLISKKDSKIKIKRNLIDFGSKKNVHQQL
jgi:hypothetical protein